MCEIRKQLVALWPVGPRRPTATPERSPLKQSKRNIWKELELGFKARDEVALEVMREVFARLTYGQEFKLSDGRVARLEKLFEPDVCRNERSENHERPCFGVDVVIDRGTSDHVEITAFQTGWGMAIKPPKGKHENTSH